MIGLIKLRGMDGNDWFVNPNGISMFTKSTPEVSRALGNPEGSVPGCTVVWVTGTPLQVKSSTDEIVEALNQLRKRNENAALELRKRADTEDWKNPDQDDEDSEDDPWEDYDDE